jgi:hypothetical protein
MRCAIGWACAGGRYRKVMKVRKRVIRSVDGVGLRREWAVRHLAEDGAEAEVLGAREPALRLLIGTGGGRHSDSDMSQCQ